MKCYPILNITFFSDGVIHGQRFLPGSNGGGIRGPEKAFGAGKNYTSTYIMPTFTNRFSKHEVIPDAMTCDGYK